VVSSLVHESSRDCIPNVEHRVGLKGVGGYANPEPASTAVTIGNEERSVLPGSVAVGGLSRCSSFCG
jgi:hypothetical protein